MRRDTRSWLDHLRIWRSVQAYEDAVLQIMYLEACLEADG